MFLDSSIPSNFNKVAELSDNYIILVKENTLTSGHSYEAYIQFFNPSTEIIHTTNYKISGGDVATYNVHYVNTQYYSYIDYIDATYTKNTYELDSITNDFWGRHDITNIGIMVGLLLALTIIIVNLATSLVHRGGIFHA